MEIINGNVLGIGVFLVLVALITTTAIIINSYSLLMFLGLLFVSIVCWIYGIGLLIAWFHN